MTTTSTATTTTTVDRFQGQAMGPRFLSEGIVVRYFHHGGVLSQARILVLEPKQEDKIMGLELLQALARDGVDLEKFFVCIYETEVSSGGWLPILQDVTDPSMPGIHEVELPIPTSSETHIRTRIDVKLFRRDHHTENIDSSNSNTSSEQQQQQLPSTKGYHGIGVVGIKRQSNIGTLWRSAYQLGSNFIFTVGMRYKNQPTDTVDAPNRMPLFELESWSDFCNFAPKGAKWIAVEMGGIPLDEFEHPRNAVYILGAEDHGLPNSVVRACHEVISIPSERYDSYNVAMAGTIVMYDRMVKQKALLNDSK